MLNLDHPSGVYLYADAARPEGDYAGEPPLRAELLNCRNMLAADRLVSIAFSLAEPARLHWDAYSAWLEWPQQLTATLFRSGPDFISALHDLQIWINEWSASPGKRPNLAPDWATARDLHETTVERFAEALVRDLAESDLCTITFCTRAGDVVLSLPALAALSLPPAPPASQATIRIQEVEATDLFLLPNGNRVYVSGLALEDIGVVSQIDHAALHKQLIITISAVPSVASHQGSEARHG